MSFYLIVGETHYSSCQEIFELGATTFEEAGEEAIQLLIREDLDPKKDCDFGVLLKVEEKQDLAPFIQKWKEERKKEELFRLKQKWDQK